MKRRDFLKLLTIAPLAPSVLAAMPKEPVEDEVEIFEISGTESYDGTYQYLHITCDIADSNQDYTVLLYGSSDGYAFKRIEDFSIEDNGNGTYLVSIPKEVL